MSARRPPDKQIDLLTVPALRQALQVAAQVVRMDPTYLPLFERLERELRAMESKSTSFERAIALADFGQHLDNTSGNILPQF